jgi:hypothetical protein
MGQRKGDASRTTVVRGERDALERRQAVLVELSALSLAGLGHAARRRSATAEVEAVRAADGWLDLVDQGKVAESWDATAALFKAAVTKEQWRSALSAARAPLARPLSRKLKAKRVVTPLAGALRGQYVVIDYASVYENELEATETVTPMLDADGQWRIASYFIR